MVLNNYNHNLWQMVFFSFCAHAQNFICNNTLCAYKIKAFATLEHFILDYIFTHFAPLLSSFGLVYTPPLSFVKKNYGFSRKYLFTALTKAFDSLLRYDFSHINLSSLLDR